MKKINVIRYIALFAIVCSLVGCADDDSRLLGIAFDRDHLELVKGETVRLNVVAHPADANAEPVEYESSDYGVAFVDEQGNVTARSKGSAVITAKTGLHAATCDVHVIVPAVAGDIFYSDGTWSDVLEDSKTPIGVVFWTGNPTADDPTLEADFPQCTHGLVISLYEESGNDKPWQDNSDEILIGEWVEANTEYISITSGRAGSAHNNLNRIMGYNNTKAIEAYNAANSGREVTCVQRAVAFRTSVKAPGGTSDWYMPSAKEVSLLCTGIFDGDIAKINDVDYDPVKMTANMWMINGVLSKIEGAAPLDGFAGYWSSSEESAETAYEVYFANGQLYNWPKNYPGPRDVYRFVLAF